MDGEENMSDRSSAEVFGITFEELAKNPDPRNKRLAKKIYKLTKNYDFSAYQMDCDNALVVLGLAKWTRDEDGSRMTLYKGEDYGEY